VVHRKRLLSIDVLIDTGRETNFVDLSIAYNGWASGLRERVFNSIDVNGYRNSDTNRERLRLRLRLDRIVNRLSLNDRFKNRFDRRSGRRFDRA
jgi:hypothetical protein